MTTVGFATQSLERGDGMMGVGRGMGALILLGGLILLPVGAPAQTSDSTEIAAASHQFSAAYVRGDTATIRELYTPDAVLLPPASEVRGRDAIVRYFAPGPRRENVSHAMESSELRIDGDVAVDVGTWRNVWRIDGGPAQEAADRYLVVWRRGGDGAWRIEYDMWHRPSS